MEERKANFARAKPIVCKNNIKSVLFKTGNRTRVERHGGNAGSTFQTMEETFNMTNMTNMTIAKQTLKTGVICMLAGLGAVCANAAIAQNWPTSKPITVLNPAPGGGILDVLLRTTSEFVSKRIAQTIIVESRSGGAGVPVGQAIATGPADGYLIGSNYASHVINPYSIKSLPYDTFRDFVAVTRLVNLNIVMVAPTGAPYSSLPELIKYAKDNPGKISFGVPGLGGSVHFGFEAFRMAAGLSTEAVPYRGEAPVLPDLLGGRLNLSILSTGTSQPQVTAGKLKVLAAVSETRLPSHPTVPTIGEGFSGFKPLLTWYGLYMRAGTPPAIVERLAAEYHAAGQDPVVKAKLEGGGLMPIGSTPAEFAAQLKSEHELYGDLIRKTGFKFE